MIEVVNLNKSFGELHVLKDINITIKQGEKVVVVGPSGSGKSTFLRCLNCMEDPTSGSVIFNGVDIADMHVDINVHRQKMGMVFQHFNLFNNKTVIENIMLAPVYVEKKRMRARRRQRLLGKAPKDTQLLSDKQIREAAREQALSLLKRIGLEDKADVYPAMLSGGQKQRVAIAGIIAMEPDCIVLDEPTAMLDPRGRRDVIETIHRLNREKGITILLITHYMDEAAGADRVVVMDKGEILLDGAPREVFSQVEAVKATGLDLPQPTELLYRLKQKGVDLPDGVIDTDECIDILAGILAK